ncbi:MAG TPA: HD-GYP domain-containing protein [Terriglobales bacterium]|nr:HD-GYP domain-containing protein [Terriglobales bacterium]
MDKPSLSGLQYLMRNVLPGKSAARRFVKAIEVGLQQDKNNAEVIGARCERGAEIARKIGFNEGVAQGIHQLDEHWNGGGYPEHRKGEEISLLSRIMNVSQSLEAFASGRSPADGIQVVSERSGSWFDPEIVRVVRTLEKDESLWQQFFSQEARQYAMQMEPGMAVTATPERMDSICEAFAQVIDAKSHYTYRHSMGVASAAVRIAEAMQLAPNTVTMVRRAALLHDIGKLSVSNAILEKPGKLTNDEWQVMRMHPVYTRLILRMINGFEQLSFIAAAHHERLDGKGYPENLDGDNLPLTARILCVADVYQALHEERPYREGLPNKVVFGMMDEDAPTRLDPKCLDALKQHKEIEAEAQPKAASVAAGK